MFARVRRLCSSSRLTTARARAQHLGVDMTEPHLWFREARAMKRRLILHTGPTNSGKTHQALLRLLQHKNRGIYLGPLRLLAWEVYDRIRTQHPCRLVTGQEILETEGVADAHAHRSCTVEMADLQSQFAVGIIDEGQLLSDRSRGWAWTNALLGLQCEELHICGSENVVEIVEKIAALTGDVIVERNVYTRLSPLNVGRQSINNYSNVLPGDCVVAFSRRELYAIKRQIESNNKGMRCCVVYGGLPPETRRQQATLFSDPLSGFDVLVASDAVGMGLNLAIKRVVFSDLTKFDGRSRRRLFPSEIKQIAGRAGRYGMMHGEREKEGDGGEEDKDEGGIVTSLSGSDLPAIRSALNTSLPRLRRAGLFPSLSQLQLLSVFVDLGVTQQLLTEFWRDKLEREWGVGAGEAKAEAEAEAADEALVQQSVKDCMNVGSIAKTFGSPAGLARELELFLRSAGSPSPSPKAKAKLRPLLQMFRDFAPGKGKGTSSEGVFFLCDLEERLALAAILDGIDGLSFQEKYTTCMAPVGPDDEELKGAFTLLVSAKARDGVAPLTALDLDDEPEFGHPRPPRTPADVLRLEGLHKKAELYLWLSQRCPDAYPDVIEARRVADNCSDLISLVLTRSPDEGRRRGRGREYDEPADSWQKKKKKKMRKKGAEAEKKERNSRGPG